MKVHAAYHAVRGPVLIWLFRGVGRAFQGASCGKREGIPFFIPSAPFPPKARGRRGFAVSGSGPGFFFEYVAAYEEAAVALGFTPEQAKLLVRQTFSGSLALLAATGESPEALRIQVTSPGGTTKASLDAMEAGKFRAIVASALIAAKQRGEELGRK